MKRRKNRRRITNRRRRVTRRNPQRRRRAVAVRRRRTVRRRRNSIIPSVLMANPRRRRSRTRARSIRRRRNPASRSLSFGSALGSVKDIFSTDMLTTAAGAVGASALTSFVITKWGPYKLSGNAWVLKTDTEFKLPFLVNKTGEPNHIGRAVYSVAISAGAAFVAKKFGGKMGGNLAKGAVISGLVMAANEIVASFSKSTTTVTTGAGTSEYFPKNAAPRPQLRYGMNGQGTAGAGYDAIRAFGASPMTQSSAFSNNAFHN